MKIFIASSYSSKVNFETGQVQPEYRQWLEGIIDLLENQGHEVFAAIRKDNYKINNQDPASACRLDIARIKESDVLLALLTSGVSGGVQTEVGIAVALGKKVILAHEPEQQLSYFNAAMVKAGVVKEAFLPLSQDELASMFT